MAGEEAENIERFVEDQAFGSSHPLPRLQVVSLSSCVSPVELTD